MTSPSYCVDCHPQVLEAKRLQKLEELEAKRAAKEEEKEAKRRARFEEEESRRQVCALPSH